MNWICERCKQPGEKRHHRRICRGCDNAEARKHSRRVKNQLASASHINPEDSLAVLQIRLRSRISDLNYLEQKEPSSKGMRRKVLEVQIESLEKRIKELKLPIKHKVFGNERVAA